MKVTKLILILVSILLVTGCASEPQKPETKVYVIEENPQPKTLTFEIDQNNPNEWRKQSIEERNKINRIRSLQERKDEEEIFEKKSKYSNIRRDVDGVVTIGYDQKIDNPKDSYKFHKTTNDDPEWYETEAAHEDTGVKIIFVED